MSLLFRDALLAVLFLSGLVRAQDCCGGESTPSAPAGPGVLRVCADPNNMPFSNAKGEGFENRIAELIAKELGMKLEYRFMSQRLGFFRETLKAGECELVMGAPTEFEKALTTKAYYRSSYVFVSRGDRHLEIKSFDDPTLKSLKIGLQLTPGATPPAEALGRRGIVDNIVGFPVSAAPSATEPSSATIIKAVVDGQIDVAIVWGPPAGYFAKQQPTPLKITPVEDQSTTVAFDISMAVKRGNKELRDKLNAAITKNQKQIYKILDDYGIVRLAPAPAVTKGAP
jgi:mxaJ protein